jgi:hypothetical protein
LTNSVIFIGLKRCYGNRSRFGKWAEI